MLGLLIQEIYPDDVLVTRYEEEKKRRPSTCSVRETVRSRSPLCELLRPIARDIGLM